MQVMHSLPQHLREPGLLRQRATELGKGHLFASYLVRQFGLFTADEKKDRNVYGGGKDRKLALDRHKVATVRALTFKYFPVQPAGDVKREEM